MREQGLLIEALQFGLVEHLDGAAIQPGGRGVLTCRRAKTGYATNK
ncbi:hypothetical protein [Polaromonas sp.]